MAGRMAGWRGRRIVWRAVLALPFQAATGRRVVYAVLAAPVGAAGFFLALVGGATLASRVHAALGRSLLDRPMAVNREPGGRMRVIGHSLAMAVPNLFVLVATAYMGAVVVLNFGYPLRVIGVEDVNRLHGAWGGPTLLGAWAVHAAGAVPLLWVAAFTVTALTALQGSALRLTGVCAPAVTGTWTAAVRADGAADASAPGTPDATADPPRPPEGPGPPTPN